MAQMTGGQALVQALKQEGVQTIFGLPGVQLDWAFDALYAERDAIRVIHTRHEQAAAYMADGYARTTGRVGTFLVVPGPGLLNATAALSTAYACSSPVLALTGQIPSQWIGAGRGLLHEIDDQLGMIRHVTKWAARGMAPAEIPGLVHEAFRQLRSGRPRPVELEVPPDVLQATGEVDLGTPLPVERPAGDSDLIEQAARVLGRAECPLIFAGGGVLASGAWEELRRVAELLVAPVIMSANGRGALSDRHHLAHEQLSSPQLLATADAILAVGTRLMPYWGQAIPESDRPCIRIDADARQIDRPLPPTIGIVADAAVGLAALAERIERHNRKRASRRDELVALQREVAALVNGWEPQASYGRALRAALPDDAIIVNESTQVGYWCSHGLPVYEPRTFLTSGYQGTLGYGFPTALGAGMANPDRVVVSVNGDGGFMYNVQELATAAQHGIAVTTVVFDDGAFGNVKRTQQEAFGGRVIASDLRNPDLARVAELFGVWGIRAEGPDELRVALQQATAAREPALIHVPVGPFPNFFPKLRERLRQRPAHAIALDFTNERR
ncbi:MAG: thiamine pyrophosphate-binding protein [Chloroflexi bacterium]|nr:thiamine pyrophosphate-binding protein [Chloroflexota bacterium]